MSFIDPRAAALHGIGFSSVMVAIQGLLQSHKPDEEYPIIFGGAARRAKRRKQEEEALLLALLM